MKHLILAKFKPEITEEEKTRMLPDITRIFEGTLTIEGINDVKVMKNCVHRDNRFDLMIQMTMDRTALELYDACCWHKEWKNTYGILLEKKAVFDYED